jgi:hypothetical protein
VTGCDLLGFALVLLSMFFFYFAGRGRALVARSTVVAMSACSFLCFAHGPPITHLHICDRSTAKTRALGAIHRP